MSLLGSAALAMWWDIAPQVLADFEDWHSHEHFTERLGIPGFHRASRWRNAADGEGVFVMYEQASRVRSYDCFERCHSANSTTDMGRSRPSARQTSAAGTLPTRDIRLGRQQCVAHRSLSHSKWLTVGGHLLSFKHR